MIRLILKIALCSLILVLTHPYAFFSFAFHPLQVTVYWDERDQDEDVFVSRVDPSDGSVNRVYQEESKRDQDQKSKLKLKFKIFYFPSRTDFIYSTLLGEETGRVVFNNSLQSFLTDHFHPPNFYV